MERTSKIFDTIEQYLANTLSIEDRKVLEKEMAEDPELFLEVQKHRELRDVLQDTELLDFKRKLQIAQQEYYAEEKETRRLNWLRYSGAAAAIIVLIGMGSLFWENLGKQASATELYAEYYQPYPAQGQVRSEKDKQHKNITAAYAHAQYNEVVNSFTILNDDEKTNELKLYAGNSYLNLSKEEKAIAVLKTIPTTSGLYEDGLWYEVLSYLKMNNKEATLTSLEKLILYDGRYKTKALELRVKLIQK